MNTKFLENGVEQISPLLANDFPNEWYQYATTDHFWMQWRFYSLQNQLKRIGLLPTSPLRVLDVGAGEGTLSLQLETVSQWTIDRADLNRMALCQSNRGKGRKLYYNIMQEEAPFVGNYDVVILYDVLEHLASTHLFLNSAVKHLKPGGHLLINVPALMWLYSRYDRDVGHERRYTKESLAKELVHCNLRILDSSYWGFSLLPIVLLRKLFLALPRKQGVIKTGFQPPLSLINQILDYIGILETRSIPNPPLGTSLMMALRRG